MPLAWLTSAEVIRVEERNILNKRCILGNSIWPQHTLLRPAALVESVGEGCGL